jgi:hypothetical protein
MTRYTVVASVLALFLCGGCDEVEVGPDGELVLTTARMAPSEGKITCGKTEDVYENTSGSSQCKHVSVTNGCERESEILEWFYNERGLKHYGAAPNRPINGGSTKAYDITVEDDRGLDIDCGDGTDEEDKCCSYTIESCNERSNTAEESPYLL